MRILLLAVAILFLATIQTSSAAGPKRPLTGDANLTYDSLDKALLKFLDSIDATACTVVVSKDHKVLYSRGYGWHDESKKTPVKPDAFFRIASITKAFTNAAVYESILAGRLKLDDAAFEKIAPKPKPLDPRVMTITIQQLLEHEGGWDPAMTFDPLFRQGIIAKELKLDDRSMAPCDAVRYMLTRELQFDPGAKSVYSNFGFLVLGRVLEAVEKKKTYFECVESLVLKPAGITDVKPIQRRGDAREVWNPVKELPFELLDAAGGLVATAPAVDKFLQTHWLMGPRRKAEDHYDVTFFGSIPGTTAMATQRADGRNVTVLINARREQHFHEDDARLKSLVDEELDKISGK